MRNNEVKILLCIVSIFIIFILTGYILRIDRFGMSQISWVDCVQINNIKYNSDFDRIPVEASSIGEKIGEVKFEVSEKVHNPNYRFRNGDATFLDVGTELYYFESNSNAIAVKLNEQYFIYKSDLFQ